MSRIVIAGTKAWNRRAFERWSANAPHEARFVSARNELTAEMLDAFAPDFVFFLHWSWLIPPSVFERWECVVFHMTDLPYGRGGSPLQNLIVRGHETTRLSAIRVVEGLDAGPVYLKRDLSLCGSAEEIYERATELSFSMIETILAERPVPQPQSGEAVSFQRRTPEQSRIELGPGATLDTLFDFIRMLDADTYPRAFVEHGGFRFEFSRVSRRAGQLQADVTIRTVETEA